MSREAAVGKDICTTSYGEEIRNEFDKIHAGLVANYGKPKNDFNYLRSGSIWIEPWDWTDGLRAKDRVLESHWAQSSLHHQINAIQLEATALSEHKSYLTVSYEFDGFEHYRDGKQARVTPVF